MNFLISSFADFVNNVLLPFGASGIFVAAVLAELIVFVPQLSLIIGLGFNLTGQFTWLEVKGLILSVALPESLGATFGSLFVYFIAFYGGQILLEKYGRLVGLRWSRVEKFKQQLEGSKSLNWFLYFVRALPGVPHYLINISCGLIQLSLWRYLTLTFLGTITRTTIYIILGFYFGKSFNKILDVAGAVGLVISITALLLLAGWIAYNWRGKNVKKDDTNKDQEGAEKFSKD